MLDLDRIESNKEKIISELKLTGREGIQDLIDAMEDGGFFEAPCSGKYHLCEYGGLAEHSLNVLMIAREMAASFCVGTEVTDKEIIICSLLHDLGKMGDHGKTNYVENILKSGKRSEAEPFCTNKNLTYVDHEIRSVYIAERYIYLSEEEENAIIHHNGMYGKFDTPFASYYDKQKLSFIIHTADMWASRFMEVD